MIKRILFFAYGSLSYLIFLGTFLYAIGFIGNFGVPRTLDGPASGPSGYQSGDRCRTTGALCGAAQRHGAQVVQGLVDADCAEADRTFHLRSLFEPRTHPAVLAVAAIGRRDLVGRRPDRAIRLAGIVRFRLGTGAGLDIPDQSLRSVRTASGLALPAGPTVHTCGLGLRALPARATSALRRLALRLLDDAGDDPRAPALLGRDDGLHPDGDPIRRARPGARARRSLRRRTADPCRCSFRSPASARPNRCPVLSRMGRTRFS